MDERWYKIRYRGYKLSKSENDYADKWFSSMQDNKSQIVEDLINQLPEEEISYPFLNNEYKYYQKTSKDQLPRYYRKSSDGEETVFGSQY